MRVEVGLKDNFKKNRIKLTWAGHVETIGVEKLVKRADAQNVEGKGGEEDCNSVLC